MHPHKWELIKNVAQNDSKNLGLIYHLDGEGEVHLRENKGLLGKINRPLGEEVGDMIVL